MSSKQVKDDTLVTIGKKDSLNYVMAVERVLKNNPKCTIRAHANQALKAMKIAYHMMKKGDIKGNKGVGNFWIEEFETERDGKKIKLMGEEVSIVLERNGK